MIKFGYKSNQHKVLYYSCFEEFFFNVLHYMTRIDGSSLTFKIWPERQHFYYKNIRVRKVSILNKNEIEQCGQDII